jgi:hypothetical protein
MLVVKYISLYAVMRTPLAAVVWVVPERLGRSLGQ